MRLKTTLIVYNFSLIFLMFIVTNNASAQRSPERVISSKIADCDGAVNLPKEGRFSIKFPSEAGVYADVDKYKNKLEFNQVNSVWLKYSPKHNGFLDLDVKVNHSSFEIAFFEVDSKKRCDDIMLGEAELLLHKTVNKESNFSIKSSDYSFLKRIKDSSLLYIYINSKEKQVNKIDVNLSFKTESFEEAVADLIQEIDQRDDLNAPTYRLCLRDEETKLPVEGNIVIEGSKKYDALYRGSDLLLSLTRSLKYNATIDAYGYFPKDTSFRIRDLKESSDTIYLIPVSQGKQVELDGIEFLPQSPVLTVEAQDKLLRLRDFLALNSSVKIEVQGHVHQLGPNNFRSKRLSNRRARSVRRYLINAGIEKDRIEAVGYGNTKMKYPEPENATEEQANRRVEVKVK